MDNDKLKFYVSLFLLYMAVVFLLAFLLEDHPFIVSGIFIFLGLGGAAYFGQKIGDILAEREIEKIKKEKEAKISAEAAEAEASSEVPELTLRDLKYIVKRAKELNSPPEAHIQFKGKYVVIRSPGFGHAMPIRRGVEDPDK